MNLQEPTREQLLEELAQARSRIQALEASLTRHVEIQERLVDVTEQGDGRPEREEESSRLRRVVGDRTAELREALRGLREQMAERARAHQALARREEYFRVLLDMQSDLVGIFNPDGTRRYINAVAEHLLGYRPEDLVGRSAFEILHPEELESGRALLEECLRTPNRQISLEMRLKHKDGSWRWHEVCVQNLIDDPAIQGIVASSRDITKRREVEEALRLSEERFRTLVQNLSEVIVIVNADGTRRYINAAVERSLGYKPEELLGGSVFEIMHPDDVERMKALYEQALANPEESLLLEMRLRQKDGSWRWFEAICQNLLDDPAIRGFVVNSRDVTERREAREALRLSEERFRALMQNLSDAIIIVGPDGRRHYISGAAERMMGYAPEEMVGRNAFEILHPEDVERVKAHFEHLVRTPGHTGTVELRSRHKDGSWRSLECISTNLLDHPAIRGIVVNTRNITERKLAEDVLRKERDFTRSLIQASPAFFLAVEPDGRIRMMNDSMLDAFGYCQEEVVGKYVLQTLGAPSDYGIALEAFNRITKSGESVNFEIRMLARDGRELLVEWRGRPVLGAGGGLDFLFAVGIDTTERRKMEQEAFKAQKIESIGVLAGGIAHDFNNILGAIVLNISLAEMEAGKPGERFHELLAEARRASLRARGITQQLLTFSRGGLPVRKPVQITDTIRDAAGLAMTGSRSRCVFDLADDLWLVEADEGQIGQVISNLVINADQALPQGGEILVKAENVRVSRKQNGLRLKAGKYVKISVRDEGVGIPGEHLSKIFDPYFSSKRKGSGLGLAISYSIIDKHGGTIRVGSKPGVETVFSVYLPASNKRLSLERDRMEEITLSAGRILVVDDDEMLRNAVSRALQKMGCGVVLEADGARAVETYRKARAEGACFDAVLMDLTIPGGMGGREAAGRLLEIDPGARVICCSGYSSDPILANYREFGFCGAIVKPYRLEDLAEILRKALEKDPGDPAPT